MRLRHERRRPLVTDGHDPDPGSIETVQQPEKAFAGNGEGVADADGAEGVGNVPTDGPDRFGDGLGRRSNVYIGLGRRIGGFRCVSRELDVGGVGYLVHIPLSTFYELPEAESPASLFIHTHVREDLIALYGFLRPAEKQLFEKLITVSGIGRAGRSPVSPPSSPPAHG